MGGRLCAALRVGSGDSPADSLLPGAFRIELSLCIWLLAPWYPSASFGYSLGWERSAGVHTDSCVPSWVLLSTYGGLAFGKRHLLSYSTLQVPL